MSNQEAARTPALSIQDLPGDNWETRFSKQVARNIAFYKDAQKLTTKQLADACNVVYAGEGEIKLPTLNGLFAGKRKSISVTEIMVFAKALKVAPILLMVPVMTGESVEILPGHVMDTPDALDYITGNDRRFGMGSNAVQQGGSFSYDFDEKAWDALWLTMEHKDALNRLVYENAVWIARVALAPEHPNRSKTDIERAKGSLIHRFKELEVIRLQLEKNGVPLPPIDSRISSVLASRSDIDKPLVGISRSELIAGMTNILRNMERETSESA